MTSYKRDMPLTEAEALANQFIEEIKKLGITNAEIAGSIRRKSPIIGDIDMIVEGDLRAIGQVPNVEVKSGGPDMITLVYGNQQFNVYRSIKDTWGSFLFFLTGPAQYQIGYRMKAKKQGWLLNQYGLFDADGKCIASKTEAEIYSALGKPFKEPWLRGK